MSLLYTFPVYNKFWAPYDEGIISVAAQRLLAGEIPYKDFFIIMYPPGQIYAVALLYKVFPSPLIAGRIYTVFISVGISMLVFYMSLLLTNRLVISLFSWLVALLSAAPRLGAIPAPIWPGIFLGLCTLYTYMKYRENPPKAYILLIAGITAGLSMLFRHDIGLFAFVSVLAALFVGLLYNKDGIRQIALFIGGALAVILPCLIYFIDKSAIKDMVDSLVLFPFVRHQMSALPFPKPCLDFSMIFHGSLHFIKVNQYYIPILVYISVSIYLLKEFFGKKQNSKSLMLIALLLFGILTFSPVMIRTDPAHLLSVIQPSIILFGFILHKGSLYKFNFRPMTLPRFVIGSVLLFLFALLSVKNIDKYFKNTIRKLYKKEIIRTEFDQGTIYIPRDERNEVLNTVNFIKDNTIPGDRIYIGNIAHWKDDFGGSLIIYFLANRLPSTKYYEIAPGIITNPDVQREIKDSLLAHNVNLLVLQDVDLSNLSKRDTSTDRFILDNFIERHFKSARKFGKYNIYLKR